MKRKPEQINQLPPDFQWDDEDGVIWSKVHDPDKDSYFSYRGTIIIADDDYYFFAKKRGRPE